MSTAELPRQHVVRVEKRWYQALYEEDSLRLINLLEDNPNLHLWKRGWESEPLRKVKGRPRNYWRKTMVSDWKGRTALHVGARRGCVRLLEQVLGLCRSSGRSVRIISSSHRETENAGGESREEISCAVDSSVDITADGTGESNQGDGSSTDSDSELEMDEHDDERLNKMTRRRRQSWSLEKLLLAVDGEYKLDAIAIAIVNGNRNVVSLLLEAGVTCPTVADRHVIRFESYPIKEDLDKWDKEDEHRHRLQDITKQVIERFRGDKDFQVLVLRRYALHRDFNFLPREEFLFHMLFDQHVDDEIVHLCGAESSQTNELCRLKANELYEIIVTVIANLASSSSPDLWAFLWSLQDGQGRPPLHVAADDKSPPFLDGGVWKPLALVKHVSPPVNEETLKEAVNARDGAGRTAWHRSAALGNRTSLIAVFESLSWRMSPQDPYSNAWGLGNDVLDAKKQYLSCTKWEELEQNRIGWKRLFGNSMRERESSVVTRMLWKSRTGFCHRTSLDVTTFDSFEDSRLIDPAYEDRCSEGPRDNVAHGDSLTTLAALHSVIIHKHSDLCASFFKWPLGDVLMLPNLNYQSVILYKRPSRSPDDRKFSVQFDVNILEFAAVVGDPKVLMTMLQQFPYASGKRMAKHQTVCPALQFVAASGKYDLLQMIIDEGYDPLEEDVNGNALHHATKGLSILGGEIMFAPHWIDYVNCEQILVSEEQRRKDTKDRSNRECLMTDEALVEREGCINLLIQLGCDIFKACGKGQVPYPAKNASPKFLSWWHEKHAKEFGLAQNAQNLATTAISVTAALVATASYVGPLQPPLGYSDSSPSGIRLYITAIQVFIICDTMSFYLAIAAIIFALIPCLPMPQQPMTTELRRTRRMVNVAVALLFPSIIFVLVAFAAGSIAVVQSNQTEWNGGGLTIGTASIGGIICLAATIMFSIRVLAIMFNKNRIIKSVYNVTSF